MELIVNDNNEIVGFNYLSRDGIQIDQEEAPDKMLTDFLSKKWIWSDDKIIDNPNYQEPNITDPGPSPEMLAINELGIQFAKHLAGGE